MTDASTPRPWHVYDDRQFTVYPGIDAAKDSVVIFGAKDDQCGVRGDTPEARKANAALIVRAVNAHDDLLIAAKEAVIMLVEIAKLTSANPMAEGSCVPKLIAAIKKAESP